MAYKNGKVWADDSVKTTGNAVGIGLSADHQTILADGKDLSFITVRIADKDGATVPHSKIAIKFSIEGPGELVATDNGDAANLVSFHSSEREAFNGLCLVIVRGKPGQAGVIKLKAASSGLDGTPADRHVLCRYNSTIPSKQFSSCILRLLNLSID